MPVVPRVFSDKTPEEIEEWGFLGVSEDVIFNMLGMTQKQREYAKTTDKWIFNYRKGLAKREMELARTLTNSKDPQLVKELLKSTSLVEKKILDDNVEFRIEAPAWLTSKVHKETRGRKKVAQTNN
mgnify:CR=1 FL=1